MTTYYDLLGITPGATAVDVRRAFRQAAKRHHPDTASGTVGEMSRLNAAYETLKDPSKRAAYDQSLQRKAYRQPARPDAQTPTVLDPFAFKAQVFRPLDRTLIQALKALDSALVEVAYDLYDDAYIARFTTALTRAEAALTKAHQRLFSHPWPRPFVSALNLYRQGLRQGDDAIEEFHSFTLTLDADALAIGVDLLRTANQMLDEARDALGA